MVKKKVGGKKRKIVRWCDNCGWAFEGAGKVRRLDTGGGSGVFLCRKCWGKEMAYRRGRNKTLAPSNRFSIRKFPK